MFNISLSDTLCHQLKEQGYKFIDDVNVSWYEDMLVSIDRLYVNCYVTETEYKKIREKISWWLKKVCHKNWGLKMTIKEILSNYTSLSDYIIEVNGEMYDEYKHGDLVHIDTEIKEVYHNF